jgi:murein DD-endopeptidase MepM/ murein hydrolase activator NlpD
VAGVSALGRTRRGRRRSLLLTVRRLPRQVRRPRVLWSLIAVTVALCCCGGLGTVAVLGAVGDSAGFEADLIACREALGTGDPEALAALDDEQLDNGVLIVQVGVDLAVPPRGWVIAVATAMQESSLRNLPHLGADNDHDSLGLFQQRPSQGWGTPEQILDPRYATTAFYERLLQVEGWEQLPLTVAAQVVQRSAHPDAYARHEPLAVALVNEVAQGAAGAAAFAGDLRCAELGEVTAAGWSRPTPGPVWSGFRTANRPDHYGIDIGAPRGTVIRAAADGIVTLVACNASLNGAPYSCDVDGSPQVAGCGWYVTIRHGDVLTRYCHLLTRPQVDVGDQVVAGQEIGLVGSSGRSSGPHLHFEVEMHTVVEQSATGVTVQRATTDPVAFLAARGIGFECATTPADCNPVLGDRIWTEQR